MSKHPAINFWCTTTHTHGKVKLITRHLSVRINHDVGHIIVLAALRGKHAIEPVSIEHVVQLVPMDEHVPHVSRAVEQGIKGHLLSHRILHHTSNTQSSIHFCIGVRYEAKQIRERHRSSKL